MISRSLKQISSLSVSTVFSRILGLLRDVLLFSALGSGMVSSAFIIAFTIPNLFRRMLGEGALSSAFVPVFEEVRSKNEPSAFNLLNQTLSRILLYFGGIIGVMIVIVWVLTHTLSLPQNWEIAFPMLQFLLPYALLICLAAILTAALNCLGQFFLPSLSPILLNLCMIGAILIGSRILNKTDLQVAHLICLGVLFGGIVQFLLPFGLALLKKWKPRLRIDKSPEISEVGKLFATATVGAAILQINLLVSRLIAFQISDEAVSQLYVASRIVELPLGLFTVAIYTVLFPKLSRSFAEKKTSEFSNILKEGFLAMTLISLPCAIGIGMLATPILSMLFQWGNYSVQDVMATSPILAIYAACIPFYSYTALFTRAFHAEKDMKLPVVISGYSMGLNILLSLALIQPFGVKGLAIANLSTSVAQFGALSYFWLKHHKPPNSLSFLPPLSKILVSNLFLIATVAFGIHYTSSFSMNASKWQLSVSLISIIGISAAVYFTVGLVFKLHKYLPKN